MRLLLQSTGPIPASHLPRLASDRGLPERVHFGRWVPRGLGARPGRANHTASAVTRLTSERWTRQDRIRTSNDYARVKAGAVAFRGANCLLLVLHQPGEATRVGFVASKRSVGGAVQRNRAKRRLREIVRRRWPRIARTGYGLVVIANRGALHVSHEALVLDVERLLTQAGALPPPHPEGR